MFSSSVALCGPDFDFPQSYINSFYMYHTNRAELYCSFYIFSTMYTIYKDRIKQNMGNICEIFVFAMKCMHIFCMDAIEQKEEWR